MCFYRWEQMEPIKTELIGRIMIIWLEIFKMLTGLFPAAKKRTRYFLPPCFPFCFLTHFPSQSVHRKLASTQDFVPSHKQQRLAHLEGLQVQTQLYSSRALTLGFTPATFDASYTSQRGRSCRSIAEYTWMLSNPIHAKGQICKYYCTEGISSTKYVTTNKDPTTFKETLRNVCRFCIITQSTIKGFIKF